MYYKVKEGTSLAEKGVVALWFTTDKTRVMHVGGVKEHVLSIKEAIACVGEPLRNTLRVGDVVVCRGDIDYLGMNWKKGTVYTVVRSHPDGAIVVEEKVLDSDGYSRYHWHSTFVLFSTMPKCNDIG